MSNSIPQSGSYFLTTDGSVAGQHDTTANQLMQVALDYYDAVNKRNWSEVERLSIYFHPSYRADCQFSTHKQTFAESTKVMQELARDWPDFRVDIVECSANLNLKNNTAIVFCHADWIDAPPGLQTQAVRVMEWKYVDGMWLCMKSELLRGVDEVV